MVIYTKLYKGEICLKKLLFVSLFVLFLAACGGGVEHSTDDVVKAFEDAGLEVESPTEMTKEDYGIMPMKADEGVRFLIPSLGEDMGGRIFSYNNEGDLKEMKDGYDSMGEESAMLFSWTAQKGNILVQITGDLPEEKYNEYVEALEILE